MDIKQLLDKQRLFFQSGKTLDANFRINQLKLLHETIKKYEQEIHDALNKDLGKSDFESYLCEVGLTLSELSYMIKHTRKFAKDKTVHTTLSQFAAKSYIKSVPYGNVLIMSPWNYPFLLTMDPLINAIAAGNTAIVKPSAYSPYTSEVIKKIIEECFDNEYVGVVTGGRKENTELLKQKFDFIFFTGSQFVGKEVLRQAAQHLTPAVLELGGKSPCIVDSNAKVKLAARRIVFGKFLNCGQTCVAPDYILCHEDIKDELVNELCNEIHRQFPNALNNNLYGKIINDKHFDRLVNLIDNNKTVEGGHYNSNTLKIEPTVLYPITFDDEIMQDEIFGPILPIVTFKDIKDVYSLLKDKPKPLALYIFSENKSNIEYITSYVQYGGGCINDVVVHIGSSHLGFGGVGESGMGSYHGKIGFDTFSHQKSIMDKKTWMDLPIRYQPYTSFKKKLLRLFLK